MQCCTFSGGLDMCLRLIRQASVRECVGMDLYVYYSGSLFRIDEDHVFLVLEYLVKDVHPCSLSGVKAGLC